MNITRRTRFELRWNNGIDYVMGRKSLAGKDPDCVSTARVIERRIQELIRQHGGTDFACTITVVRTGEVLHRWNFGQIVADLGL